MKDPKLAEKVTIVMPSAPLEIQDENKKADTFFRFPVEILNSGSRIIKVKVMTGEDEEDGPNRLIKEVDFKLLGPLK